MGLLTKGTGPELMPFLVHMDAKNERNKVRDLVMTAELLRNVRNSESFFWIRRSGPAEDWKIEVSSIRAYVILIKNSKDDCALLELRRQDYSERWWKRFSASEQNVFFWRTG